MWAGIFGWTFGKMAFTLPTGSLLLSLPGLHKMDCHKAFISTGLSAIFLSLFIVSSVQAEWVLTAPPREDAASGAKVYGPLAEYLSEVLGDSVVYKHPGSWSRYQRDIRADKYDIVFDGPHFMSWRMKKKGHTPVARLPGNLSFVLIAKADDSGIKKVKDLVNKKVCALSPPNLSALTILAEFGDVGMPILKTITGGMGNVFDAFKKGECRGAVLREELYKTKLSDADRASTKIIFSSEPVPNQGITVSTRIAESARKKIALALIGENPGTAQILKRFAPKEDTMIPAGSEDYEPYYNLLTGVIIGW